MDSPGEFEKLDPKIEVKKLLDDLPIIESVPGQFVKHFAEHFEKAEKELFKSICMPSSLFGKIIEPQPIKWETDPKVSFKLIAQQAPIVNDYRSIAFVHRCDHCDDRQIWQKANVIDFGSYACPSCLHVAMRSGKTFKLRNRICRPIS